MRHGQHLSFQTYQSPSQQTPPRRRPCQPRRRFAPGHPRALRFPATQAPRPPGLPARVVARTRPAPRGPFSTTRPSFVTPAPVNAGALCVDARRCGSRLNDRAYPSAPRPRRRPDLVCVFCWWSRLSCCAQRVVALPCRVAVSPRPPPQTRPASSVGFRQSSRERFPSPLCPA